MKKIDRAETELKCDRSICKRERGRWLVPLDSYSDAQVSNLLERESVIDILTLE